MKFVCEWRKNWKNVEIENTPNVYNSRTYKIHSINNECKTIIRLAELDSISHFSYLWFCKYVNSLVCPKFNKIVYNEELVKNNC